MKTSLPLVLALTFAPLASAQLLGGPAPSIVLHGGTYGSGASLPTERAIPDLARERFNDQISSVTINSGVWELCEHGNFGGRCEIVDASIADLASLGLNDQVSSIRPAGARPSTGPVTTMPSNAGIIFYAEDGRRGESIGLADSERDLSRLRFNDRARSVDIRNGVWRLCTDGNFGGRCEYADSSTRSLADLGLTGQVSSAERTQFERTPDRYSIALFTDSNLRGNFAGFDDGVSNLSTYNFNDRASSVLVTRGRWLLCQDIDFRGTCEVADATMDDLNVLALNDRISSLRRYDDRRDGRDGRGGTTDPYPRRDDRGWDDDNQDGVRGDETEFFPRPLYRGERIRNEDGAATRLCRDRGYSEAVYKGRGRYLSDVLCR